MKQSKVIQISVFGILFLISLFIWNYMLVGRNNKGVTETSQATIPLLTVSADGKNINQLHGYQGSVDASLIRDSITPIYENEVKVMLTYAKSDVSVVSYKIYDTDNKTILGNGDTAFHKVKGKKTANIKIKERLENGKTYLMELSVKQNDKTIRYFTRVIYGTSFHLKECLDFAQKFHDAALTEGNTEFISQYLETAEGTTSNNLANVDLKSTQEAVSYATLKPQVESVYPATVKEISENVTSLELRYILSAENTDGTKQYYQATEYFRVRYAKDRMYLLNYERNMEAYMRYDTIDRSNNRILLGIGSSQKQLISKNGGKKVAFVVQDELWYYDYQKSNMHKVFSFEGEDYRDSNGKEPAYPRYYRNAEKKLAREQRKLSRMQKGSNNRNKQSRQITNAYDCVCIEDLDMKAMSRSLNFGKSVSDNGWGMFTTFLRYKLEEQGKKLVKVDRFFASSRPVLFVVTKMQKRKILR